MSRPKAVVTTGAVPVVVTSLVGCGSGADAEPATSTSASPSDAASFASNLGPLEEILGQGAFYEDRGAIIASITRAENTVAQCMADQGFEYWPRAPATEAIVFPDGPVPGTREFVEEYGFGLWDFPRDGGGGYEYELQLSEEELAYLSGMSEAERASYDEAMSGPITADPGGRLQ